MVVGKILLWLLLATHLSIGAMDLGYHAVKGINTEMHLMRPAAETNADAVAQPLLGLSFVPVAIGLLASLIGPAGLRRSVAKSAALVGAGVHLAMLLPVYLYPEVWVAEHLHPNMTVEMIVVFRSVFAGFCLLLFITTPADTEPAGERSIAGMFMYVFAAKLFFLHATAFYFELVSTAPPFLRLSGVPAQAPYLYGELMVQNLVAVSHFPGAFAMVLALCQLIPLRDAAFISGATQLAWAASIRAELSILNLFIDDARAISPDNLIVIHSALGVLCFIIYIALIFTATPPGPALIPRTNKKEEKQIKQE